MFFFDTVVSSIGRAIRATEPGMHESVTDGLRARGQYTELLSLADSQASLGPPWDANVPPVLRCHTGMKVDRHALTELKISRKGRSDDAFSCRLGTIDLVLVA
eukprot:jgi/Picsp_1/83/NSC_00083-R1_---NA---